jgi:hypothetical protein
MAKQNAMLAKIYAAAELKYERLFHDKISMLTQLGEDAAIITANLTLQVGPKRAENFCTTYVKTFNEIARMMFEDQKDDSEFVYAKEKLDRQIKRIVGEKNFVPWEVRYGERDG